MTNYTAAINQLNTLSSSGAFGIEGPPVATETSVYYGDSSVPRQTGGVV